jgi:hypothetical protein
MKPGRSEWAICFLLSSIRRCNPGENGRPALLIQASMKPGRSARVVCFLLSCIRRCNPGGNGRPALLIRASMKVETNPLGCPLVLSSPPKRS